MDKPTRACADCGTSLAGTHANTKRCQPCNRLKRIKSIPRTACEACGGSMEGKRADAVYCSLSCAQRIGHRRRNPLPAERACGDCGVDITGRHLRAKYCETCGARRRDNTPLPVRIDRECAFCGKPFVAKRVDAACCSRKCTQARINAVHNPKIRHEPRPCPACGAEFTPKRRDQVACSRACYKQHISKYSPANPAPPPGAHLVKLNRATPAARKYTFNEHYFDAIDTPDKAYWLGFIAGDGCISNGALVIGLAAKDVDHLRTLAEDVQSTYPVYMGAATVNGKTYPNATLRLSSWRLVEALARHGIEPRKSATLEPWDGPADLIPHYWRGLVDADGHIARGPGWQIDLVGTEAVVTAFGAWAKSVEPSIGAQAHPHKTIWKFAIGGRILARTVARALYEDAATALPRKAERAAVLIGRVPHGKSTEP